MLVRRGRLDLDRPVLTWIRQALALPGVEIAPLTPEVAVRASALGGGVSDPADRIIAATALEARAPLVTLDEGLRNSGVVETVP